MTERTDDQIERLAGRWLREQGPKDAPDSLRLRLGEIVAFRPTVRRRAGALLLAASFVALVAVTATAIVVGALLVNEHAPKPSLRATPPPAVSPSPASSARVSVEPSIDPSATLPEIQFAGLLDAEHGRVVGRTSFFATADGGRSWTTTPLPGPRVGRGVLGAAFADPDHGWLATLDSADMSSRVFDVWRTTDAGRTWQKTVLHEGASFSDTMGAADFSVIDRDDLFVWIEGGMPNRWTSDLYESTDGGATWSGPRTSANGVSGPATFADATRGVAAGGASGRDLLVSSNGGATWHAVPYPLPGGAARDLTTFAGPARFWDDRHGAIAAIYSTPDLLPMLVILSTGDGGATWSIAATQHEFGRVAFVDPAHWLVVQAGDSVLETADAGATWTARPFARDMGKISSLSMPDRLNGWAIVDDLCDSSSSCQSRSLVATTDGWRTTRTLAPDSGDAQRTPSPSSSPRLASPRPSDVAAARRAVTDYTAALVRGDYAAAWRWLSAQDRERLGSLASFAAERRVFFANVHATFTVIAEPSDVGPITDWISGLDPASIDVSRAVLVEVTYPPLAGNNAGWDLFIVAPGRGPDGIVLYDVR